MKLKLAGYEAKPQKQFQGEIQAFCAHADGPVPMGATPVYADGEGNYFAAGSRGDQLAAMPFLPGSPADGDNGGFMPLGDFSAAGLGDDTIGITASLAAGLPAQGSADWLGKAAANAMLGGAPGTPLADVMQTLGLSNPMGAGALGGAVAAAANLAGLGPAGSLLGGALGNGTKGLTDALGAQTLSGLAQAAGLGGIPGLGPAAGILGGQLGNLADAITSGGWSDALGQAGGALNSLLGNGAGVDPSALFKNIVADADANAGGLGNFDPATIGSAALDQAAGKLLDQWKVDDESSAAEHIAHKMVTDNQDQIQEAITDPDGFLAKLKAMINGVSSGATLWAARLEDKDLTAPEIVAQGVATILAEGKPISRMSDPLAPSGALILEGAATVLSAGLPTARLTSKTAAPGKMIITGAPTVLVGGPSMLMAPPSSAPKADAPGNAGPASPDAPKSTGTGSGNGGGDGNGGGETSANGDSTPSTAGKDPTPATAPSGQTPNPNTGQTPTLTVSVDQPGAGGDCDTHEGLDVGHAFITVDDGKGNTETVGFYPETGSHAIPCIDATVPGELRNDATHPSDVSRTYPLTHEQYDNIRDYVSQVQNHPPDYDLNDYNCTDFAIEAARRGGVNLPDTRGSWLCGGGSNPGHLGEHLAGRTCGPSTATTTTTTTGTTTGTTMP
jgi:hypothetical protein